MFIDESIIIVKSGDGGNGASSFRKEKYIQFGGPDGGDGGNGGSIYFIVSNNINTLVDFRYNKFYRAQNGESGNKKNMHGKQGKDLIINVPLGTMVKDFETEKLLLDMNEEGKKSLFLKGGKGGFGNSRFKSSVKRAPKIALKGKPGIELKIKLELKLLADIALVGYPSVGKSSFINKVSAVKSKVANYHFTTLNPKIGVVRLEESKSFLIADIPGLIEGAHEGVGLGDKFLKHIERCKIILHLIDVSAIEGRCPIEDFEKINKELHKYSHKLSNKKQIVVANKMDLLYDSKNFDDLKNYLNKKNIELYPISVLFNDGLDKVLYKAYDLIQKTEEYILETEYSVDDIILSKSKMEENWVINVDNDGVFNVSGKIVNNVLNTYLFNDNDSIVNFIHILKNLGLEKELEKHNIKDGDTVRIFDLEFDYVV